MAVIRKISFRGILDDLDSATSGWVSKAESAVKDQADKLFHENEKNVQDLIKAAERKADEIANRTSAKIEDIAGSASKEAAKTHAETISDTTWDRLRPYVIGTTAVVGLVGAAALWKLRS